MPRPSFPSFSQFIHIHPIIRCYATYPADKASSNKQKRETKQILSLSPTKGWATPGPILRHLAGWTGFCKSSSQWQGSMDQCWNDCKEIKKCPDKTWSSATSLFTNITGLPWDPTRTSMVRNRRLNAQFSRSFF